MWAEFWAVCPVPLGGVSLLALTVLVTVASPNVVWSQGEGDAYNLFSFLSVTLAEIIAFGSSRQPHYGSKSGGKQDRGSSELRESCPSVQKEIDWLASHSY